MSYVPDDLQYTKDHEWVRLDDSGVATCGITDHAQTMLEDVVFVEMPEPGRQVQQRDQVAVIESERSVFDVHAPVSGKVIEVNTALEENPELINNDPYGDGWLAKIEAADLGELDSLIRPSDPAFAEFIAAEREKYGK